MDKDFLLCSEEARILYHEYASSMPIIDYHCHLITRQIAEDTRYNNITEVWLGGDHYKWRAMRGNGVEEKYITGDGSDYEKFEHWANTMPYCIGNPLYHWTHLELQRYFGVYEPLSGKNAKEVWEQCNRVLASPDFTTRGLIKRSNVEVICTTDDPIDDLRYHKQIAMNDAFDVAVLPSFRPDKALNINKPGFADYMKKLGETAGVEIKTIDDVYDALSRRLDFFESAGCKVSDHAFDVVTYEKPNLMTVNTALSAALAGDTVDGRMEAAYRTAIMLFLGAEYGKRNMVMQIHVAALRDNNPVMYRLLGPDTGYDAIEDRPYAKALAQLLGDLEDKGALPKTILYSLNPGDNEMLIALATCFNGGGVKGKMQLGSGWWFNDTKDGMIRQMTTLANIGLLSRFVGMLTDSRSFLSYTRHEYFRRIMCNLIGSWAADGEIPFDREMLGTIVKDISYNNAKEYFFGK